MMKITNNFDSKHNYKNQSTTIGANKAITQSFSPSISFQGANNSTKSLFGPLIKKLGKFIHHPKASQIKADEGFPQIVGIVKGKILASDIKRLKTGSILPDGSKVVIENPFYNYFQKATKMNNRSEWACMNLNNRGFDVKLPKQKNSKGYLSVYLIKSPEAKREYNKIFVDGINKIQMKANIAADKAVKKFILNVKSSGLFPNPLEDPDFSAAASFLGTFEQNKTVQNIFNEFVKKYKNK